MVHRLTRRRFLLVSAAGAMAAGRAHARSPQFRWRGIAFGAEATVTLPARDGAASALAAVAADLDRLENIFSLYRPGAQLAQLNAEGVIDGPAPDLIEVLDLAGRVHAATRGAFDPTIQPLWAAHAKAAAAGGRPRSDQLAAFGERCGWQHLMISRGRVAFARAGMALTLNGIAQGYAADRIAALLRRRGFDDVLIDTGEIVGLGTSPAGGAWQVALAGPDGRLLRYCRLADAAVATSSPMGTVLDPAGRVGHILDPRTGRAVARWRTVSVTAPSAAQADALSTAFCILDRAAIDAALAQFPGARVALLDT